MSTLWIDTDYGFDDLWAIILLRHWAVQIAGISLVAGNAPLRQVISNAVGAREAYSLNALLYAGAEKPLKRELETAERFLGPKGMQSRGQYLPEVRLDQALPDAIDGLTTWLLSASENERRDILAIGPLTNLAQLLSDTPETCEKITRLIWMGGSNGVGNHSAQAEFNALADPEAAMIVAQANLPLDVIDLTLCRQVMFDESDVPECELLTSDLLTGYLDIALSRGRKQMTIYDPVAALAFIKPRAFTFQHCTLSVSTERDDTYGKTNFEPCSESLTRRAVKVDRQAAQICLSALARRGDRVD